MRSPAPIELIPRVARAAAGALLAAAIAGHHAGAVTRLASADGQFWDIQDTSPWSQDSGGIATGGNANPFNGFGYLKLRVRTTAGATVVPTRYLTGFGLAHDGAERVDSITPIAAGGVVVSRARSGRRRSARWRSAPPRSAAAHGRGATRSRG